MSALRWSAGLFNFGFFFPWRIIVHLPCSCSTPNVSDTPIKHKTHTHTHRQYTRTPHTNTPTRAAQSISFPRRPTPSRAPRPKTLNPLRPPTPPQRARVHRTRAPTRASRARYIPPPIPPRAPTPNLAPPPQRAPIARHPLCPAATSGAPVTPSASVHAPSRATVARARTRSRNINSTSVHARA